MGVWGLPRRFPVALKALPEPWRERICDDAKGVDLFIIAAARDGMNKDDFDFDMRVVYHPSEIF